MIRRKRKDKIIFFLQTNDLSIKDELDDVSDAIVDIDPVNKSIKSKIKFQFLFVQERLSYFRLARYTDDAKAAANKLSSTSK